jgi:hypothetical protein
MRKTLSLVAAAGLVSGLLAVAPAGAARTRGLEHLDPGGQPTLREKLPVNVVLIGYRRDDVSVSELRSALPSTYRPAIQSRALYGTLEELGITQEFRYRIAFAGRRYENRFFRQLKALATPAPLTLFQQEYNAQNGNARDVTNNHFIDAPSVERWLALHSPRGVDTRRNTVFLINWYDRPDFRFHVYTKTGEPDPDTGYDFGVLRESRKISAWGGTPADDEESGYGATRRVWFHDLSSGPTAADGSWNINDDDLDGDGVADYRIPPAWEYGAYRDASALTGDLGKLVRYVALDLLFATSPIYPVELPTSRIPATLNLDSNTYEGWSGVDASRRYIRPGLVMSELADLPLRKRLSYDNQDLPFSGDARRCFLLQFVDERPCYPALRFPSFANLFLQNTFQLERTKDDGGSVDYELPIFNYATTKDYPTPLGYADDNYVDGTQSYVFNFISPAIVELGYGLSTTIIHEVGHHVGLSHPHNGYDSESGVFFGPTGDFYFAWLGDYSNTIMSYIDLNWDFSQFDQDNMARFLVSAFVEGANRLAAEALAAPHPERASDELRAADRAVAAAERAFSRHRYLRALRHAGRAYELAAQGAAEAGVDVPESERRAAQVRRAARQAEAAHQSDEFIDTLDGPRGAP